MEKYLRVGVITSPHGVRGEVKVYPTTDDVMRFKKLDKVILDLGRGETRELKIRQVKFFKNMVILKFDGVDTMNEVEGWRQKDLLITRDQAIPLEEDEFFITDLIGLNVVTDEGETLGTYIGSLYLYDTVSQTTRMLTSGGREKSFFSRRSVTASWTWISTRKKCLFMFSRDFSICRGGIDELSCTYPVPGNDHERSGDEYSRPRGCKGNRII